MQIEQSVWTVDAGWMPYPPGRSCASAQLVFVFGSRMLLESSAWLPAVQAAYPQAALIGCSTAGVIYDTTVLDQVVVVSALQFQHSWVTHTSAPIATYEDSSRVGAYLAQTLPHEQLVHVFVLSDGLTINGSDLVSGITQHLPEHVSVTGGLASDGEAFGRTMVLLNGQPEAQIVAAVGLYGSQLRIGYGSIGGWDPFGPERLITRAKDNILYELDGTSALGFYKRYLGEHADQLPASGLLFPRSLTIGNETEQVVRTILSVNERDQSMTFAGDMPEGAYARLMKTNFDRLIDGAINAASASVAPLADQQAEFALLISCVGRKLVLQQRIEEEVEGVRDVLGHQAVLAGFYSYGEISPLMSTGRCALHNQTMTITTLSERTEGP
ncbi:MAG: FIST N-terminal domain-containing protein [Roseiflexaceae bacterium]